MAGHAEFYCHDATCTGAGGFEIYLHNSTLEEPGWVFDDDTCPHCGGFIYENQIDIEALEDGINFGVGLEQGIKGLNEEGFNQLAQVILDELNRQGVKYSE